MHEIAQEPNQSTETPTNADSEAVTTNADTDVDPTDGDTGPTAAADDPDPDPGASNAPGSSQGSKATLGDHLRKLMASRGISQVDLARDSGLDRADLNRLINNKRPPRAEEIRVIAQTLGIHQIELVTGVELPPEVEKGVEMIVELETTALAERQRAERLQAQLDALEKAIEDERTAGLKAKFDMAQEHRLELNAMRKEMSQMRSTHQSELEEVRRMQSAHVDDLNAKHTLQTMQLQQALQTRTAEIGRLLATIAQRDGAIATLEDQNSTLRKRLAAQANAAGAQAFFAGLAGLAVGGSLGAAAGSSSRRR